MTTTIRTFSGSRPQTAEIKTFISRLVDFAALHRQRRALTRLDAHLLRDVGLTAGEAKDEAARAAWDVPSNWRA